MNEAVTKSLKERLTAIMKIGKKSRLVLALSLLALIAVMIAAVVLGASADTKGGKPPVLYISSEGERTKAALTGSYSWSYLGKNVQSDSVAPTEFEYAQDNIVNLTARQQFILGTQKLNKDRKYEFTLSQLLVFKDGRTIVFKTAEPSIMNGALYLQAPPGAGQYTYSITLNYKDRGTVNYGFVVRVDMRNFDLTEILKHKTQYIGDSGKVLNLVGNLPVPDNRFIQRYISMITSRKPYKLTVFYEVKNGSLDGRAWELLDTENKLHSNLEKNALVLFCMIDNLDDIDFAFRNSKSPSLDSSKYDKSITFSRASIEQKYGKLSKLVGNLKQLQAAIDTE